MGPCRLIGKATTRRMRRHSCHCRGAQLRPRGRRGRGGALRSRPRHGVRTAGGRQGRGGGLPHPRRGQAARRGRLSGHRDRGTACEGHRARRRRDGAGRVRQADRRAHVRRPGDPGSARSSGARRRSRPAASTARSSRSCTAPTWASTRMPRTSSTRCLRASLVRRLGRLHAGHRHQRHPLRHPDPAAEPGEPRAC